MPKNKGKGGKNRKRGKNEADDEKRELVFKEDGQEYAQVLRMLGNGRCEAMCIDGTKRLCHIRGKMHKKVWIAAGDIILVGLRDYQDDKADVILKYMPDEARLLKAYSELPEGVRLNEGIGGGIDGDDDEGDGNDYIEFEDEDIDKIWGVRVFLLKRWDFYKFYGMMIWCYVMGSDFIVDVFWIFMLYCEIIIWYYAEF